MKTILFTAAILLCVSCQDKAEKTELDIAFERHDLEMKRQEIIQDSLFYYYDLNSELQSEFWQLYSEPGNGNKLLKISKQMELNGKKCDALIERLDMPLESDTVTY